MKWPLTFYTNRVPEPFAGYAIGPVILIVPSRKDDRPLYLHEVQHVKQFFWTLGLHGLLYHFVRRYRLWAEATAYAVQVRAGDDLDRMAGFMARDVYRLDITQERARREIHSYI